MPSADNLVLVILRSLQTMVGTITKCISSMTIQIVLQMVISLQMRHGQEIQVISR